MSFTSRIVVFDDGRGQISRLLGTSLNVVISPHRRTCCGTMEYRDLSGRSKSGEQTPCASNNISTSTPSLRQKNLKVGYTAVGDCKRQGRSCMEQVPSQQGEEENVREGEKSSTTPARV